MMNDDQLTRYSRHILLPEIDIAGQMAINQAKVMVVGLGGLGSPVAMYLAASGVGDLTLVDFDTVDASNLQRQIIHNEHTLGMNKARSAEQAILAQNSGVNVSSIEEQVPPSGWSERVKQVDIVVDCTDNFATRFAINAACYQQKIPLVSAAAIRFEGQISVFTYQDDHSPCYQCLYSPDASDDLRCAEAGVMAPVVGVMGSLQALEVLKLITHTGKPLVGRLLLFDAKTLQWRELSLPKDPHCALCSQL